MGNLAPKISKSISSFLLFILENLPEYKTFELITYSTKKKNLSYDVPGQIKAGRIKSM